MHPRILYIRVRHGNNMMKYRIPEKYIIQCQMCAQQPHKFYIFVFAQSVTEINTKALVD